MLRAILLSGCLLLGACHGPPQADRMPPPSAYLRFEDRLAAGLRLLALPSREPCTKTESHGNVVTITSVRPEQCFKMGLPRRYRGIWLFGTDGNWLCAATTRGCSYASAPYVAAIQVRMNDRFLDALCPGDLFLIDFVGRQTNFRHDVVRKGVVTVDQLMSIRQIAAAQCDRTHVTLK